MPTCSRGDGHGPLPRRNRQRDGLEAWGAVQRVLGAQSLAGDIEPPGPRQHPLPCDYIHLSVDGLYTCCWCNLRYDGDDFEACSTAAIVDHLHKHRAAGHHILTDAFDDLQADAAENDAWIKSAGKDCGS
jgi:hypothetical protein